MRKVMKNPDINYMNDNRLLNKPVLAKIMKDLRLSRYSVIVNKIYHLAKDLTIDDFDIAFTTEKLWDFFHLDTYKKIVYISHTCRKAKKGETQKTHHVFLAIKKDKSSVE
jgi:hypothetical protein